jgi:hypothetical protein
MIVESHWPADGGLMVFTILAGGGGLVFFRRRGCTLSEAAAYGCTAFLMAQAWVGQVAYMAGAARYYPLLLLLAALPGLKTAPRLPAALLDQLKAGVGFARQYPLPAAGLLTVWGYTALSCVWPMPRQYGTVLESLASLWRHEESIFTLGRDATAAAVPVLNHIVFLAPWQPRLAVVLANLAACLAVGFATYALSRRYAWPSMAITVTLLVVSMTRLVHQGMAAHSEMLPAAASLTAVLALYRSVERPQALDLVMLAGTIGYSVAGGRLCFLMPIVLLGLSVIVLGRRHGLRPWGRNGARPAGVLLMAVAILIVFSQAGPVIANLSAGRPWIGAAPWERVTFNADGLGGAVANAARYLALSVDFPEFVDRGVRWLFGAGPLDGLKQLYFSTVAAALDGRGAAAAFDWSWTASHRFVWFGPVGFLLVIPSVAIAFWRGPDRLKSTALAFSAYWILVSLIAAWRPENVRLMTRFFVCSGFLMAFALPPWRLRRNGRLLLQVLGVLIMAHAILY